MQSILIIFITLILTNQSFAHCPLEFEREEMTYCLSYNWQNAQIKRRGEFIDLEELSPVINKEKSQAFRRKTSTAFFKVWAKGDKDHKSVYFKNLRIFPYMQMIDGAHHDASSAVEYMQDYLNEGSGYLVSQMALLDMEVGGCWSFRLTFSNENKISTSVKLENIENYTNVSQERNFDLLNICEICSQEPIEGEGGGSHPGHH